MQEAPGSSTTTTTAACVSVSPCGHLQNIRTTGDPGMSNPDPHHTSTRQKACEHAAVSTIISFTGGPDCGQPEVRTTRQKLRTGHVEFCDLSPIRRALRPPSRSRRPALREATHAQILKQRRQVHGLAFRECHLGQVGRQLMLSRKTVSNAFSAAMASAFP